MNDYSDPSKLLVQINTSDNVLIFANYYQLKSMSEMIKDLETDTNCLFKSAKGYYILDSQFSSKVWGLMLTMFDERFNFDRKILLSIEGIKFRALIDFIDFYQLQPKEEFLDTIFEYYVAKNNSYDRLRQIADDLDSGKIAYKFYEPPDYPFPLPSLADLQSSVPVPNCSPAIVSKTSFCNKIIDKVKDPVMFGMLLITISSIVYSYVRK